MLRVGLVKLASVNVDLDEIPNYFGIHGLAAEGAVKSAVYDLAVPRLVDFARAHGVPLTFFAVGADLERPESAEALRAAAAGGVEIGNHTLTHDYRLTTRSRAQILEEVRGGADAIERATGRRPRGFRAPGYTITDTVFDVLDELEVAYDSSVFPCPLYWLAKASALGLIRVRGRESRSIVDHPQVLRAPTRPYRVGRPYSTRGRGIVELPIQVTPGLRLPVIGTSLTLAGPTGARLLAAQCAGEPLVNLELHGIDVLDRHDGLEALVPYQVDVRVPLSRKLDSLGAAIALLRGRGYTFVTLEEAASAVL
ncbi:MAG: polysaccharide deacetylase family protein [Myxococcales bacterium]|nr:polysaccharide deacetylase family protein [Myxococcales bacterium]